MKNFILVLLVAVCVGCACNVIAADVTPPQLESVDVLIEHIGPKDYMITVTVVVTDAESGICPDAQIMDRCERIHHITFLTEGGAKIIFYDFYRTSGDRFRGAYTATEKMIMDDGSSTWLIDSFAAMDDAGNELREP